MSAPLISVTENGPYLVSGDVVLGRKVPIVSEHGEPLGWKSPEPIETKDRYALCRCGMSDNKPFCDGSHARNDFDGTETASTVGYEQTADSLGGTGIEIFDDRAICEHAGFCGNQQSNVWKMAGATDDTVVRSQVMAMVERCPSGALTYKIDGEFVEPDLPTEVSVVPNGPLWVAGGIPIERADGEPFETRNRVTLCRCGASGNKPLCDGSHKETGFTG